jgi:hypothetical protein
MSSFNNSSYQTNEYKKKVFQYFVLELLLDDTLSRSDRLTIVNNNLNKIVINTAEPVKNLYEDFKKNTNNYMFAYYLSRLYERRLAEKETIRASKYLNFSEYIIGLDKDIKTMDWNNFLKVKKLNPDLYSIYGNTMHSLINEYLKSGYVNKVTSKENIDDVISKKKEALKQELDEESEDEQTESDTETLDSTEEEEEREVEEWYYDNNQSKKRKFEQQVLDIIVQYEQIKKQRMIENQKKQQNSNGIYNFTRNLLKLYILYCLVMIVAINVKKNSSYINNITQKTFNKFNILDITKTLDEFQIMDKAYNSTENLVEQIQNFKPFTK